MQTRHLGQGFEVSALGLGCMGMSRCYSVIPAPADMIPVLRGAVDRGVTVLDTAAEVFGPCSNDRPVGEAMAPFKGRVKIVTKFAGPASSRRTSCRP